MKIILSLAFGTLFLLSLTGCGIIGGAGQDISSAGHAVTKGAHAVQKAL